MSDLLAPVILVSSRIELNTIIKILCLAGGPYSVTVRSRTAKAQFKDFSKLY